jgi:hypothetical protein
MVSTPSQDTAARAMAAKAVAESMLRLLAGWAAPVGEAPLEVAGLKGRALTMVWKGLGPWKVL